MKALTVILILLLSAAVVPSPLGAATLFGLVDTGELYVSTDGGVNWMAQSALPVSDAVGINAGETASELFLVTRSGITHRSTDSGANWTAMGAVTASDVIAMLIRPSGDLLLLTETGILWKSSDDGATFTSVAALTASNYVSLEADDSGNLYALTKTGEVARSSDEGVNWSVVGVVTTSGAVEVRAVWANLFVLTHTGNIAKSTNQGVSWTMVGTVSHTGMTALTRDGTDLVITSKEGLVASSSDGVTWNWVGSINQLFVMALGNDTPLATGIGPSRPPDIRGLDLFPVWPNPQVSNDGETNVSFLLPERTSVTIEVYDVNGRRVAARAPEVFGEGVRHNVLWSMGRLPTGIYFVRLTTATGATASRKIAVIR